MPVSFHPSFLNALKARKWQPQANLYYFKIDLLDYKGFKESMSLYEQKLRDALKRYYQITSKGKFIFEEYCAKDPSIDYVVLIYIV